MRRLYSLPLIFLIFTALSLPTYSLNLQSKQAFLLPNQETPLKVLQTFGFTEFLQTSLQEDPTKTMANLFAYYIDGRVLQNFVSTIFDRNQEDNVLSYEQLLSIIEGNGLSEGEAPRVLDLVSLDQDSKVDFVGFETVSNILFHDALSLVTYIYIIEDRDNPELARGFDLWTVEDSIRKIFKRLGNTYPVPRCEEMEYLFGQADRDHDKKLNIQEFHYFLSIFLTYYRAGIKNNEYAAIIFKDSLFEDLWEKDQQKHDELVEFSSASLAKFLQTALHDEVLSLVGHILFSKFDEDGSGLISPEEFKTLLGLFGSTDAEIALIFAATDSNQDGNIDFAEFLKALEIFTRRLTAEFGYIYLVETKQTVNFENIWNLLQGFNQADLALINEREVEEIFNRFDDGDGVLDQGEFRNFVAELITYWKKRIDSQKDQNIKDVAGLDPTDENIQQIIDDKQENQTGGTDDDSGSSGTGTGTGGNTDAANDLVDQVTKDTPLENEGAADEDKTEGDETEPSDQEETTEDVDADEGSETEPSEATEQEETRASEPTDERTEQELTEATEPSDSAEGEDETEDHGPEATRSQPSSQEETTEHVDDDEASEAEPSEATEQEETRASEPTDERTEQELTEATEPSDSAEGEDETEDNGSEATESQPSSQEETTEDVDGEKASETEPSEATEEEATEATEPSDEVTEVTPSEQTDSELTETRPSEITEEEPTEPTQSGQTGSELTEDEATENTSQDDVDNEETQTEPSEATAQESTELTTPTDKEGADQETEVTDETDETDDEVAKSEPVDRGVTESEPTETADKEEETEASASEPTKQDLTDLTETEPSVEDENTEETDSDDEAVDTRLVLISKKADFNIDGKSYLTRQEKNLRALDKIGGGNLNFSS